MQASPTGSRFSLGNSTARWFLAAGTSAFFWTMPAPGDTIAISESQPKPNYGLTSDPLDLRQLTDGQLSGRPIWTHPESVGWSKRTPIVLQGTITKTDDLGFSSIQVRTDASSRADVSHPRRIDVYCSPGGDRWQLAGTATSDESTAPDNASVWIDVPLSVDCGPAVAMVIHGRGPYVMMDEIRLAGRSSSRVVSGATQPVTLATRELAAHSTELLRTSLERHGRGQIEAMFGQVGGPPEAWLVEPWVALSPGQRTGAGNDRITIRNLSGADASYIVGLTNPDARELRLPMSIEASRPLQTSVYGVEPVLAADGTMVFDPMVSMDPVAPVVLPPRSVRYLFVRHQTVESQADVTILLGSRESPLSKLQVALSPLQVPRVATAEAPKVVVWSYVGDQPIWTPGRYAQNERFLRESGVNVQVVHPADIPLPGPLSEWVAKEARFREQLRLYRGAETVLLYLAWDSRLDAKAPGQEGAVQAWVRRVSGIMKEEGYSTDRWALYPVDEPQGRGLNVLTEAAAWIKAAIPEVRIYANPARISAADVLPGGRLTRLLPLIDIWQTKLGQASSTFAASMRQRTGAEWWVFQVPISPAKSVPPVCYRRIGPEAFRLGATGVGVWAFSDTGGSSAWDDLDGYRPDWAMVYEAPGGIVTGRRWEAFQAGIRDLWALQRCQAAGTTAGEATQVACRELAADLDALRAAEECEAQGE